MVLWMTTTFGEPEPQWTRVALPDWIEGDLQQWTPDAYNSSGGWLLTTRGLYYVTIGEKQSNEPT